MAYNIPQLTGLLHDEGYDLIIASTKENCRYFTGYTPVIKTLNPYYGQSFAIVDSTHPDKVSIVHAAGESDQILDADVSPLHIETYGTFYREHDGVSDLTYQEKLLQKFSNPSSSWPSATEALVQLIKKVGQTCQIRQVGYDEDGMLPETLKCLQLAFPQVKWIAVSKSLRRVRQFKTVFEIEMLERSARINESAIEESIARVQVGTSESEVALRFNMALARQGAHPALTMIKTGRAAVGGQRRQRSDIQLQAGDILWFDSDAIYDGYWSDIARVYAVEHINPLLLKRYQALRNGMLEAASFIRPGVSGKQVFDCVMNTVHRSGFPEYRRHHVGHGIGLEPYELPILSPSDDNIIEEGMVLSVETPYYEFGMGALHIEDPLLVAETGNRFLTSNPVPELKII